MPPAPPPTIHGDRAARRAWIQLDWAASAFSTVLITLVVTYVERVAFPHGAWGMEAGVVWAWTLAAAMLVSAVLAPWAAAWADRHDAHQRALVAATIFAIGGLLALASTPPTARVAVLAAVAAACVGFDIAQVFTGSLLPRIADGRDLDRLSAQGFAAGYAGGAIAGGSCSRSPPPSPASAAATARVTPPTRAPRSSTSHAASGPPARPSRTAGSPPCCSAR
jgi:MFS-type transporter involved in bile tolerance (Atg22 family)